jgi:hypothetical protein
LEIRKGRVGNATAKGMTFMATIERQFQMNRL